MENGDVAIDLPAPTNEESKSILAINRETVHRICSGQVVLSLATAVKELVENSLDAGATSIEIRLREYGSESVEVIDNGLGVEEGNYEGLTLKHHTSKIREFSDLVEVETFGFRGEALSSLCALSDLVICTRHKSADLGVKLTFDSNGQISSKVPCARQVGTTVSLTNLFSSLPVRHKEFTRNLKREFIKMTQVLYAYCLISTGVKLLCTNQTKKGNRSVVVSTQGSSSYRGNITSIFGVKQTNSLLDFEKKDPDEQHLEEMGLLRSDCSTDLFILEGCISSCAHGQGRSTSDRQFFFINNRPCEPAKVAKVVNEVYHQYNIHQYPFVFMNIKTNRSSVDINVTPDKRKIFLNNEKLLVAIVKATLLKLFENIPSSFEYQNVAIARMESPSVSCPQSQHKTTVSSLSFKGLSGLKRFSHTSIATENKKSEVFANDNKTLNCTRGVKRSIDITYERSSKKQLCLNGFVKVTKNEEEDNGEKETKVKENSEVNIEESIVFSTKLQNDSQIVDSVSSAILTEELNILKESEENMDTVSSSMTELKSSTPNESEFLHEEQTSVISARVEFENEITKNQDQISEESARERNECELILDEPFKKLTRKTVNFKISLDMVKNRLKKQKLVKVNEQEEKEKTRIRFYTEIDPSRNKNAEEELRKEISKDMFSKMSIIGQFNLGFIVTRLGPDLFIIDQHATDEKYNFEMLQLNTVINNQKLVIPQSLELTAVNEGILIDNLEVFTKNGFEFAIDGDAEPTKRVRLTAKPISRNWEFGKEDIDELLFMLQDAPQTMCRPSRVRAMFASRACRKSVMIGTALNKATMRKLVNHMGELEQPWNCPHGRPTMRHLVNLELLQKKCS